MIQIWQVPSECGPSNLVVLGLIATKSQFATKFNGICTYIDEILGKYSNYVPQNNGNILQSHFVESFSLDNMTHMNKNPSQ